ncbi:MAG: lactate racemase domain-containing protein, partial [Bacillota bacterium]
MKIRLGYGKGFQEAELPEDNIIKILEQNDVPSDAKADVPDILRTALANPIGTERLRDIVKPGEKIAVITSDTTRPIPTWEVMPVVLEELEAAGVADDDVTLVFALGSHRAHTEDERRRLAGAAYERIRCVDSDPAKCVHLGTTSRGTPVDITRDVALADRIVLLGNIEYHYFAGYSGGIKALMPGASTPEAIQANHSMMVETAACAGNLDSNPLRQDLEEAGRICPV